MHDPAATTILAEAERTVAEQLREAHAIALERVLERLRDPKARLLDLSRALEVLGHQLALADGRATGNLNVRSVDGEPDHDWELRGWSRGPPPARLGPAGPGAAASRLDTGRRRVHRRGAGAGAEGGPAVAGAPGGDAMLVAALEVDEAQSGLLPVEDDEGAAQTEPASSWGLT